MHGQGRCPGCEVRSIAVTLSTIVGTVSLCRVCAVQGSKPEFVAALMEVEELEHVWRGSVAHQGR